MIKEKTPGMSLIVRTATRSTVGFIMLYGIYIFSNEHVSPGGGFAGGIIIALAFMSIMLAYGRDLALSKVPQSFLSFLGSLGVFFLLSVALLGLVLVYFFFSFFSGGEPFAFLGVCAFPFSYLAIAVKVSAGISVIFIALVLLRAGRGPKL